MQGRDLIGIAQTGTGKTAAFALPILHKLLPIPARRRSSAPACSCSARRANSPARSRRASAISRRGLPFTIAVIFGGVPHGAQIQALAQGLDVLVATPGRLARSPGRARRASRRRSNSSCSTKSIRCSTSASSSRSAASCAASAEEAAKPLLLRDDADRHSRARRRAVARSRRGRGDADSQDRRSSRSTASSSSTVREEARHARRTLQKPGNDAHDRLHPHQARRRPRRPNPR